MYDAVYISVCIDLKCCRRVGFAGFGCDERVGCQNIFAQDRPGGQYGAICYAYGAHHTTLSPEKDRRLIEQDTVWNIAK